MHVVVVGTLVIDAIESFRFTTQRLENGMSALNRRIPIADRSMSTNLINATMLRTDRRLSAK
jgi:hypothetical protein